MKISPRAFIFDLNGTMINDMEFHIQAWTHILNDELKTGMSHEQIKSHMYGKNSELFIRVFGKDKMTDEEMGHWSMEKEKRYQHAYRPHLQLIRGLDEFLKRAHDAKIPMAIGSAAIPFNIDFVLDQLNIRKYFSAIVSADDVEVSKPHPETFLKAARLLKIPAADCLVFEDAPKGVEAAANAEMPCVVITTLHTQNEFPVAGHVVAYIKDYTDPFIQDLTNKS
jgi:beta-phosphoglucomutase